MIDRWNKIPLCWQTLQFINLTFSRLLVFQCLINSLDSVNDRRAGNLKSIVTFGQQSKRILCTESTYKAYTFTYNNIIADVTDPPG